MGEEKEVVSYKLKSTGEVPSRTSIIEKRGEVIEFTLADIHNNHASLEKAKKEISGQREFELAKMKNIESNHPIVLKLTPEQLVAASIYAQAKNILKQCDTKLDQINDIITNETAEIEAIKAQIPELDVPESIVITKENVVEKANEAVAVPAIQKDA